MVWVGAENASRSRGAISTARNGFEPERADSIKFHDYWQAAEKYQIFSSFAPRRVEDVKLRNIEKRRDEMGGGWEIEKFDVHLMPSFSGVNGEEITYNFSN